MKSQRIPIFFTIDEQYVPFLDVAIRSIMENASNEYNYEIKVLYQGLDENQKYAIASLAKDKENFEIEMVYMQEKLDTITNKEKNWLKWTLSIYFRLFIAELFPEFDKGIYLDSDIIVLGDIAELYNTSLEDNIIGAIADYSVYDNPILGKYMEEAVGVNRHEYINSGVLVMNLKKMRQKKFSQNFMRLLNTYHFDNVAPDQDYFNAMCNGNIKYIDKCWDSMPGGEKIQNPKLIHYNLFHKPWHYDDVLYQEHFWQYAKKSPFYNDILIEKNNYSEEEKAFDAKCMQDLMERAIKVPENEVTFKKVYEKGEKIRI